MGVRKPTHPDPAWLTLWAPWVERCPAHCAGGQIHFHISGGGMGILMVKIRQPEDTENISNRTKKGARVCLLSTARGDFYMIKLDTVHYHLPLR